MTHHLCCPTDRPGVPGVMKDWSGETLTIPVKNIEPVDCYVSRTRNPSDPWLVVVYDIFGMHPNMYELADWMSKHKNVSVAVPDVRRGKNWPIDAYPPPADMKEAFYKYLDEDANPSLRGIETKACIDFIKEKYNASNICLLGLCWGAKVCSLVDNYAGVRCVIGAHPSFLKSADGEATTVPTLMLPCAEDNMTLYLTGALRNKNTKLFTISEHYVATFHGFLGGRGQWHLAAEKPFVDRAKEDISEFIFRNCDLNNRTCDMENTCCQQTSDAVADPQCLAA
jgi:dienelactone hydrolase